jgi:very-short-patch-repair endonuclease
MGGLLKRMGIEAVPQYKIKRLGRGNYYVDFALPSLMLAIECDGKAYHSSPAQIRHDKKRQAELESLGWQVIRFTGSEIVTNISGCEQVLQQLLEGS